MWQLENQGLGTSTYVWTLSHSKFLVRLGWAHTSTKDFSNLCDYWPSSYGPLAQLGHITSHLHPKYRLSSKKGWGPLSSTFRSFGPIPLLFSLPPSEWCTFTCLVIYLYIYISSHNKMMHWNKVSNPWTSKWRFLKLVSYTNNTSKQGIHNTYSNP